MLMMHLPKQIEPWVTDQHLNGDNEALDRLNKGLVATGSLEFKSFRLNSSLKVCGRIFGELPHW
jgi:hypothetical protein